MTRRIELWCPACHRSMWVKAKDPPAFVLVSCTAGDVGKGPTHLLRRSKGEVR